MVIYVGIEKTDNGFFIVTYSGQKKVFQTYVEMQKEVERILNSKGADSRE